MTGSSEPDPVEHRMERAYHVAAAPEQVWEAIATADGLTAWMVPTRLEPQVGGEVSFDHGDFASTGVVTGYSPDHRFAYEEPWPISADAPIPPGMVEWFGSIGVALSDVRRDLPSITPIATEFLIESASGGNAAWSGSCQRLRHRVRTGRTSSSPRWSPGGRRCSTTSGAPGATDAASDAS